MIRDGIPHVVATIVGTHTHRPSLSLYMAGSLPEVLKLDLLAEIEQFTHEPAGPATVARANATMREFLMAARHNGDLWMDYCGRWRYLIS